MCCAPSQAFTFGSEHNTFDLNIFLFLLMSITVDGAYIPGAGIDIFIMSSLEFSIMITRHFYNQHLIDYIIVFVSLWHLAG